MDVLLQKTEYEESIKGSRFLSELFPCTTQIQAREILQNQKCKYSDATHVVHAFIVGNSGQIMGTSDDGEPSGTAGRPILDVLKGSNCTNIMITVTRWFGGTLLGTGGLVKAYQGGAKKILEKARELKIIEPLIFRKDFTFECDYNLYKTIKKQFENFNISELKENFSSQISINGQIQEDQFSLFSETLKNISNGKIILSN